IFMKATKKKREKLPKNSSNKNLTQSLGPDGTMNLSLCVIMRNLGMMRCANSGTDVRSAIQYGG
ncbi:hypothetical protein, partial [Cytobacillus firmus]|uniref:hypothetical protein n=1 Tax=Cytobacillus firmus TaxID=1399 RepID=UPI002E1BE884|nr:hypothetical protein [Cytobacillus firmus]